MDEVHRHWLGILFTAGVKYVAETGQCYWWIDLVASHQGNAKAKAEEFQVWKLQINADKSAVATMTDGNSETPIITQNIEFTDFPDPDGLEMYLVRSPGQPAVLMMPCEY